jgi:hypothetical protein
MNPSTDLKLDGCNIVGGQEGYAAGYPKMGHAMQASGRDMVYSCSWPACEQNCATHLSRL